MDTTFKIQTFSQSKEKGQEALIFSKMCKIKLQKKEYVDFDGTFEELVAKYPDDYIEAVDKGKYALYTVV